MTGSEKVITVMIADDHPMVREGLNAMIATELDMRVVGEAQDGATAMQVWEQVRPNIVLIDLLLPDGADVIRRICERSCNSHVIVLSSACGAEDIYRALESGARGFLFKDIVREMLIGSIREVHSGRRCLPVQVSARMAEGFPRPGITSREVEILGLVASGLKNKEIAAHLNISETTVHSHIKHVLGKLGASDRTHAVTIALRRGIIHL
jgi:two-component system NarL family response regulator